MIINPMLRKEITMTKKKNKHPLLRAAGLALGCMAAYNTYEYKKATSGNANRREDCRVYTGRFGDISYKHYGSGSPVLLIHALEPSANMSEWIPTALELAKTNSVYVIDLPGCGYSDKSTVDYSVYMYALAINDFVKNRICRSHETNGIHAVASATSAPLLLSAAVLMPKLYSGISFVNPVRMDNAYCNPSTNPYIVKGLCAVYNAPVIGSFIYNMQYNRKAILRSVSAIPGLDDDEKEKLADSMYEASHSGGYYGRFLYSSIHGNLLNVDIKRLLDKLNTPLLIVSGSDNRLAKKSLSTFDRENENISTIILEDINTPQFECPKKLANILNKSLLLSKIYTMQN